MAWTNYWNLNGFFWGREWQNHRTAVPWGRTLYKMHLLNSTFPLLRKTTENQIPTCYFQASCAHFRDWADRKETLLPDYCLSLLLHITIFIFVLKVIADIWTERQILYFKKAFLILNFVWLSLATEKCINISMFWGSCALFNQEFCSKYCLLSVNMYEK